MDAEFDAKTYRPVGSVAGELQSNSRFTVYLLLFVCALTAGWYFVGGNQLWIQHQEKMHRLSMRRRHGIPDHDKRPFTVAYRDVSMKRAQEEAIRIQKEEAEERRIKEEEEKRKQTALEKENVKPSPIPPAGPYTWSSFSEPTSPHVHFSSSMHAPQPEASTSTQIHEPVPPSPSPSSFVPPGALPFSDEMMSPPPEPRLKPLASNAAALNKGQKRSASSSEEEQILVVGQRKMKKSRNFTRQTLSTSDELEPMDGVIDLSSPRETRRSNGDTSSTTTDTSRRGKKRNFDTDSVAETNGTATPSRRHQKQKRRLDPQNHPSVPGRGLKRERSDVGSMLGDSELDSRHSRKRERLQDPDVSMGSIEEGSDEADYMDETEESPDSSQDASISEDPLCQGRAIGEEWEIADQRYKVGPTGARLRHTLVKQRRKKYNMPKDSLHPDARQTVQVIVEAWLTEDEYKAAKDRQELAWQDGAFNAQQDPLRTPHRKSLPTPVQGKLLLWGSTYNTPERDDEERTTQPNPFHEPPRSNGGRISLSRASLGGSIGSLGSESPLSGSNSFRNYSPRQPVRSLSKWDKQELEAAALAKLRDTKEKREADEKARLEKERLEKERLEKQAREKARLEQEAKEKARLAQEKVEREQREKREKEEKARKAKEEASAAAAAAAAAPPAITLTVPSPSPSISQGLTKEPTSSVPFPLSSSAAPSPAAASDPPTSNFFATPSASATPALTAGINGTQAKPPVPDFFGKRPASTTTPAGNSSFFGLTNAAGTGPTPAAATASAGPNPPAASAFNTQPQRPSLFGAGAAKKSLADAPALGSTTGTPSFKAPDKSATGASSSPFANPFAPKTTEANTAAPAGTTQAPIFGAAAKPADGAAAPSLFSRVSPSTAPPGGEGGATVPSAPTSIFGAGAPATPSLIFGAAAKPATPVPEAKAKPLFGSSLGPDSPSPFTAPKTGEGEKPTGSIFSGLGNTNASKGFTFGTSFVGANSGKSVFGQPAETEKAGESAGANQDGGATASSTDPSKAPSVNVSGGVFGRAMRSIPSSLGKPPGAAAPAATAAGADAPSSTAGKPSFSFSFGTPAPSAAPTPAGGPTTPSLFAFGAKPAESSTPGSVPTPNLSFNFGASASVVPNPFAPKSTEKKD